MERRFAPYPGDALVGDLEYSEREHSFRFSVAAVPDLVERIRDDGTTSLTVGTLQLEVAIATGEVLFVWGLSPRVRWRRAAIGVPHPLPGTVRLVDVGALAPGVSLALDDLGPWRSTYDEATGWICIQRDGQHDSTAIQVATNTVIGLRGDVLGSVWLHPAFV